MSSRSSNNSHSNSPRLIPGLHCVGWVKSAHGIRGEIFIILKAKEAAWLDRAEEIALLAPSAPTPTHYKIERAKPHKDGLIAALKTITDRNQAEGLRKSAVYISDELLISDEGEPIFLKQIEGFKLCGRDDEWLGTIVGFASNGPQDLLRVQTAKGHGEALVPFIEAFLVHIDFDKAVVKMDLPPGLLTVEEE